MTSNYILHWISWGRMFDGNIKSSAPSRFPFRAIYIILDHLIHQTTIMCIIAVKSKKKNIYIYIYNLKKINSRH